MAMAVWGIKNAQDDEAFGEPRGLDYSQFGKWRVATTNGSGSTTTTSYMEQMHNNPSSRKKSNSPFTGPSPFTKKT